MVDLEKNTKEIKENKLLDSIQTPYLNISHVHSWITQEKNWLKYHTPKLQKGLYFTIFILLSKSDLQGWI